MIAPTPADYERTLAAALARPTRGGFSPEEPPAPPEPTPLVLAEDEIEPDGPLDMPSHLLTTCPDYDGVDTAIAKVVQATEAKRAFGFSQAWWFARAYLSQRTREDRRAVLGRLAETVQKSKRQVYRYIVMGRTFAPETYNPELSQAVHLVAARANRPATALALAADSGWNASQLLHYLETNTQPPVTDHPVNERYDDARLLEDAIELLVKAWKDAATDPSTFEWHVRLDIKRHGVAA